jgi:ABC-2 type transport system permease protein
MLDILLRRIFLKTLRDHLKGILGWGIALMLLMIVGASQYPQIVGPLGPERERTVAQLTQTLRTFSFMTGEVTAVGTLGGFATARLLGLLPLLLSIWAIVAGVGLIRGEEQAGALEVLLSTPRHRISVFIEKALALLVSILVLVTLTGAGLWFGSLLADEALPVDALALAMLNAVPLVAFWGGAGLLAGQLSGTRSKASGSVVALLFATYLLNNIFNTMPGWSGFGWSTPFRYYTESKPLVPGETFEWLLWLVLVVLAALVMLCSALLFARRDLGSAFHLVSRPAGGTGGADRTRSRRTASGGSSALLGSVLGKSLRDLLGVTIAWSLGVSLYAVVIVSTTEQIVEPLKQMARAGGMMGALFGEVASTEGFLAVALFINLPLFMTIYSIVQVESWASEEEEGYLGMLLATPQSRGRVLAARYAATFAGLLAILVIAGTAILLSASAANLALDGTRVWSSLFALIPLVMLVSAFGLCAATWFPRPGVALPLTVALVAAMFILEVFAPLFRWPEEIRNLSMFHHYGRPLAEGIKWPGFTALSLATFLLAAASLVGLSRRDLSK